MDNDLDRFPLHTYRTDEGIVIGYREYGDLNGFPAIFHHGVPGSSLYGVHFSTAASYAQVRLICIDRPGFGTSDTYGHSTVNAWVKLMSQLIEELGLETFSVFGYSGGGPYALGCAYVLAEKVKKVAIVAGAAPVYIDEFNRVAGDTMQGWFRMYRRFPPFVNRALVYFGTRKILRKSESTQIDRAMKVEAFHQGIDGVFEYFMSIFRDWEFEMSRIEKKVDVWYGSNDNGVPPGVAEEFGKALPNSVLHRCEDEDHDSLPKNRIADILASLIE